MILLTGATGYVGGRLLQALVERGDRLRCLARSPEYLKPRVNGRAEIVQGDLLQPETLGPALAGVDTAYYLVHSMGAEGGFEDRDRRAAENFAQAAAEAGVRRIIYLGGLAHSGEELSSHLKSRLETGATLRRGTVPVIEFRASVIIGSGSLSFEMIRALTERLPVMICPKWVHTAAQPIAIEDVIAYLVAALDLPEGPGAIYEIGGGSVVSYGQIMQEYARQRGLKRWMISVPLLTPRLSSLWLGLVTPIYAGVGRALIEGLRNPTIVRDATALEAFAIRPVDHKEAIARALRNEDREFAETSWFDAISSGNGKAPVHKHFGSRIVETHEALSEKPPEAAFRPIRTIGGRNGWYFGNLLWRLRGFLDLLVGGVGLRRGRRDQNVPLVGSALDFWRVESYEPDRRLRLRAEMKVPGRAWLEFEVTPEGKGSRIRQTALFDPRGLFGLLYWYALYPIHRVMFKGMLRRIAAS